MVYDCGDNKDGDGEMPERVGVHYSWEDSVETNRKILSSHLLQLFRLLFCGQLQLRRTSHFQVTSCIITIWNRFFAILSDCHHHCLFGCSYPSLWKTRPAANAALVDLVHWTILDPLKKSVTIFMSVIALLSSVRKQSWQPSSSALQRFERPG